MLDKGGIYTVYHEGDGLVELDYRSGETFMRVFVDTTPGIDGEQWLMADQTPLLRKSFGGG